MILSCASIWDLLSTIAFDVTRAGAKSLECAKWMMVERGHSVTMAQGRIPIKLMWFKQSTWAEFVLTDDVKFIYCKMNKNKTSGKLFVSTIKMKSLTVTIKRMDVTWF